MARLNLHITVENRNTVTRIGKAKDNEKIVFFNEGTDILTVTLDQNLFKSANGKPLKRITGRQAKRLTGKSGSVYTFTVAPGNEKSLTVNSGTAVGKEVKYTAQIGTATREDPIIIIER